MRIDARNTERLQRVVGRLLGREVFATDAIDQTLIEALERIADRLDALEANAS